MNALFANLIWATPDLFQSEGIFQTRVEKLFAERLDTINLLTDDVQLAPAIEQEIQAVTSNRSSSIFAEEQFVGAANGLVLPAPVANDFAAEFDVIGQNRALLDNDFDAFLEQIAPEKIAATVDGETIDDPNAEFEAIDACVLTEEADAAARLIESADVVGFEVNWDNIDGATGFATASIDDFA